MRFLTSVHPFVCALIDPANAKGMLIPVPFSALFLLVHFTNQSNLLPSGRNYFHKAAASQKTENPPLLQRPFVCCSLVASAGTSFFLCFSLSLSWLIYANSPASSLGVEAFAFYGTNGGFWIQRQGHSLNHLGNARDEDGRYFVGVRHESLVDNHYYPYKTTVYAHLNSTSTRPFLFLIQGFFYVHPTTQVVHFSSPH